MTFIGGPIVFKSAEKILNPTKVQNVTCNVNGSFENTGCASCFGLQTSSFDTRSVCSGFSLPEPLIDSSHKTANDFD